MAGSPDRQILANLCVKYTPKQIAWRLEASEDAVVAWLAALGLKPRPEPEEETLEKIKSRPLPVSAFRRAGFEDLPEQHSGIYLLPFQGHVVYIGVSGNPDQRVLRGHAAGVHGHPGKPWDRKGALVLFVVSELAKDLEKSLIRELRPVHNQNLYTQHETRFAEVKRIVDRVLFALEDA